MELSEGYELLTPALRDYEGEGLIDSGKDVVEMTDYVVQAGWENWGQEQCGRIGRQSGSRRFTEQT